MEVANEGQGHRSKVKVTRSKKHFSMPSQHCIVMQKKPGKRSCSEMCQLPQMSRKQHRKMTVRPTSQGVLKAPVVSYCMKLHYMVPEFVLIRLQITYLSARVEKSLVFTFLHAPLWCHICQVRCIEIQISLQGNITVQVATLRLNRNITCEDQRDAFILLKSKMKFIHLLLSFIDTFRQKALT